MDIFQKKDVTFKATKDMVTKYDVAVENFLKKRIFRRV